MENASPSSSAPATNLEDPSEELDLDQEVEPEKPHSWWRELLETLVLALALAALIKLFLAQPFVIPSASMYPTLTEGDRIVVSKLTPGPFDLERGDVVVFEDPGDWLGETGGDANPVIKALAFVGLAPDPSDDHLVKRLIGMPGDTVSCASPDAQLEVNGVAIDEPYINSASGACQTAFTVTVPTGSYWVMGDNRYDSADSAWHWEQAQQPGSSVAEDDAFVPADKITGKAKWIVWPVSRWSGLEGGEEAFAGVPGA